MSIARQLADLIDTSGDVKIANLDNMPPSDWDTLLNKPAHANVDLTNADNITSGVINPQYLGVPESASPTSGKYLRGDGHWIDNCTNHSNCATNGSTYANCATNGNGKANCTNSSGNCTNHGNCGNCNFSSDMRLKTNIEFLGLKGELRWYSYNYKWDLTNRYEGVMAQELVGTKYEKALSKTPSGHAKGYYMVNYNALPV